MNKTITISKTLIGIEIYEARVLLNNTANVMYAEVYEGAARENKTYVLTPEEYAQWGTDDNYIQTLIESKY
jgi:hypothetical protein